jgi:hypothetical protein
VSACLPRSGIPEDAYRSRHAFGFRHSHSFQAAVIDADGSHPDTPLVLIGVEKIPCKFPAQMVHFAGNTVKRFVCY